MKARVLPGSEHLPRYDHMDIDLKGIEHYGASSDGIYKIPKWDVQRAKALGYVATAINTSYAYVRRSKA